MNEQFCFEHKVNKNVWEVSRFLSIYIKDLSIYF